MGNLNKDWSENRATIWLMDSAAGFGMNRALLQTRIQFHFPDHS
jgi:hypothetical protein